MCVCVYLDHVWNAREINDMNIIDFSRHFGLKKTEADEKSGFQSRFAPFFPISPPGDYFRAVGNKKHRKDPRFNFRAIGAAKIIAGGISAGAMIRTL